MAKVYVTQENPKVNILAAGRFGELNLLLLHGRQVTLSSAPVVRLLRSKLKDFTNDDFILPMGDPVAIAIASMIAAEVNNGRVKFLKWDRENSCYYSVEVDLYNNLRKENE